MSDAPRRHSSIKTDGVGTVLERTRAAAVEQFTKRLIERRARGRHELETLEIDHLARECGLVAREATANAIAACYQLGVRGATSPDRDTVEKILDGARDDAVANMQKRLDARFSHHHLPAEEVSHLSLMCGSIARKAAEEPAGESHLLGVNNPATAEDHERDTVRVTPNPQ